MSTCRTYVHNQVEELLTRYGPIDVFWFDGMWPHSQADWGGRELLTRMRALQPNILINNRLDPRPDEFEQEGEPVAYRVARGDFGTPEHHITADAGRLWESCQVST